MWRRWILAGWLGLLGGAAPAADSGAYRGPHTNGVYPETGLLTEWPDGGPRLLWKYDKLGPGWSSVTVAGSLVYVLGGAAPGHLYCFTLDGELKFRVPYGPDFQMRFDGSRSTVTISDGLAIFASGKCTVYGLDAASGQKRWGVDTVTEFDHQVPGWGFNITPLVVDERVIVPIRRGKHTLVALSKTTGKVLWATEASSFAIGDSSPAPVAAGGRRLVVCNFWHAITAVDLADGRTVWSVPGQDGGKAGTTLTPVFNEGFLLVDQDGHLPAVYRPTGDEKVFERLWQFTEKINTIPQAVILDGKVFILGPVVTEGEETVTRNGRQQTRKVQRKSLALKAYDVRTGKLLKAEEVQKEGSLCAADGMVYLLEGGEGAWQQGEPARTRLSLVQPTPEGFQVVSRFFPVLGTKEAWVNPAIAAGRLFLRHGSLIAVYDLRLASYK